MRPPLFSHAEFTSAAHETRPAPRFISTKATEVIAAMKKLLALLAALLLLTCTLPALAEDVCVLDPFGARQVTTDANYVRVVCGEANGDVMVAIRDAGGSLIYQRNWSECSGAFRSDDVYLPLTGTQSIYTVSFSSGNASADFTVTRRMPRLTGNTACSAGVPLSVITGRDSWQHATVLDTAACEGTTLVTPMLASGSYQLGTVSFTVSGGCVTVNASVSGGIDGSIDGAKVYVASNALDAAQLGRSSFAGTIGTLGSPISLYGAPYAVIYVELTVSFDPTGVPGAVVSDQPEQLQLWQLVNSTTINEAVG